ncbi:uncharacterized protein M6B38_204040 [Iris pallida]|uniref:RING-type domain-containing protein n=1 Tax=Iris pallida TaxID=29817 RepID=A0AAX6E6Z4_IRIPA|nr:uncharacterized protein M6B38_204040 [Iris pallida]
MSRLGVLEPMDLEKPGLSHEMKGFATSSSSPCSICLELVLDRERATAKLICGHEFHLDCIGSAFNAKGAMQCPNCRKVEKGRWLYANGHCSSSDLDFDGWVAEDIYDLGYSELPFRFHWCPFRGLTQLASLIEEGESQLNSYHESLGNATFGDHPSAPSSSNVCPYLALHGFPHRMHAPAPQSSADSVPENNPFPRHLNNLGGGQPFADMPNSHFPQAEPQNHNWQQQHSVPFSLLGNAADQSASQFAPRSSRSDTSTQQRLGSFIHPHPHMHGASVPRNGSNLVASMGPVIGEVRGHTHTHGHGSNHMYQQSMPSSSVRSSPFPPIRRPRPRGVTLISSVSATTSTSAEVAGFYSFASVSGSANNRSHQDAENAARHFDQVYGWGGREGFTSLPWIPLEGESQWWGPFNPNQTPQSGGSFVQRPANAERGTTQGRQENGFQRMPPAPRMPPPSFM